ncbi:efflux RND transporter periplasmic adaptor subunit [Steroidobacter flavus]|uniref:Efflux RND transporter periplasmic adaptor subunit n=1 Tax=Steroidobacter flavus TaxID=1842136 RepID=A0ABV8SPW5_9GAMM
MITMPFRSLWVASSLLACGALVACSPQPESAQAEADADSSALVTTAQLHKGSIATTVTGYGTVTPIPGKTRNLTLPQGGLVTEVQVTPGEAVRRGAILMTLTNEPTGRLAYQQSQTGLTFARAELARIKALRAKNLATESQVAAAEKALSDASTSIEAQRELGGGEARSDLKAPFDGIVLDVPVAPGERTAAGAVLVRTIANDSVQILAGFSPQDAHQIAAGMPAFIEPVAGKNPIPARVTHVQAMVNPTSRLVDVALEPVNPAAADLPTSEGARAVVTVANTTSWLAPREAVLRDEAGAYLFQIDNGHAKRINVTTPGAQDQQQVAVEGQLDASLKIAVLGAYELEDGMAVREAPADKAVD